MLIGCWHESSLNWFNTGSYVCLIVCVCVFKYVWGWVYTNTYVRPSEENKNKILSWLRTQYTEELEKDESKNVTNLCWAYEWNKSISFMKIQQVDWLVLRTELRFVLFLLPLCVSYSSFASMRLIITCLLMINETFQRFHEAFSHPVTISSELVNVYLRAHSITV